MRKQAQRNNLPQNTLFISDGGKKGKEQRGEENTRTGLFKTFKHNALNIKLFLKIITKSRKLSKVYRFFKNVLVNNSFISYYNLDKQENNRMVSFRVFLKLSMKNSILSKNIHET